MEHVDGVAPVRDAGGCVHGAAAPDCDARVCWGALVCFVNKRVWQEAQGLCEWCRSSESSIKKGLGVLPFCMHSCKPSLLVSEAVKAFLHVLRK
eukprot:450589-Pelagomonas_calceolata.AAC.1